MSNLQNGELYHQPTKKPTNKVMLGVGGGGGLSVILIWVIGMFGIDMPVEVAAEIGALLTMVVAFVVSYFVPERWIPADKVRRIKG